MAGWVTNVSVEEGDAVSVAQMLAIIDDRESRLRVRQLEAQVRIIGAERELIDEQTRSRLETQQARLNAASASVSVLHAQTELATADPGRTRIRSKHA